MRLGTAAILIALISAGSARAAVTVIGNGLAHSCYLAAKLDYGVRGGEEICTAALDSNRLSPRDRAATYVNRGVVRSNLRHYRSALDDYDRGIGFGQYLADSDLGIAHVDRASVLNALGRYTEALESVNKGLSLNTQRPEVALYNRAIAREALGDVKGAWQDYRQALVLVPTFTPAAEELKRFHVETSPAGGS
jgi:tetratricopeptide (TPR) repeat protein